MLLGMPAEDAVECVLKANPDFMKRVLVTDEAYFCGESKMLLLATAERLAAASASAAAAPASAPEASAAAPAPAHQGTSSTLITGLSDGDSDGADDVWTPMQPSAFDAIKLYSVFHRAQSSAPQIDRVQIDPSQDCGGLFLGFPSTDRDRGPALELLQKLALFRDAVGHSWHCSDTFESRAIGTYDRFMDLSDDARRTAVAAYANPLDNSKLLAAQRQMHIWRHAYEDAFKDFENMCERADLVVKAFDEARLACTVYFAGRLFSDEDLPSSISMGAHRLRVAEHKLAMLECDYMQHAVEAHRAMRYRTKLYVQMCYATVCRRALVSSK